MGVLLVALSCSACIKREPVAKDAAGAKAGSSDAAQAGGAGGGKYGTVPAVDVIGGRGIAAFTLTGATERVQVSTVDVTGQPFQHAVRAAIKEKSQNLWDVQLSAKSASEVHVGDVLLASFYFRTEYVPVESGESETEIDFELNHAPYDKSLSYAIRAGAEWKLVQAPFVAKRNFKAGEAQVLFRLGYAPQTIDLAEIKVENFGKALTLADLPKMKASYAGMSLDAPWRGPAEDRIERLRKANLTVRVRSSDGKPVAGAEVSAELTRHAFHFGTCAPAELLVSGSNEKFNAYLKELFNTVTLENDLKWQATADWGFPLERGSRGVDWLREAGMDVRGHVLVWPGWQNLPAAMKRMQHEPDKLRQAVLTHIRELVTAMKGRLLQWDVVNEPFTNHDLLDLLGYDVMVDWFKLARSIDPKPKLFINDFAILSGGGGTTEHRDHYEKMIQLLADKGAPFDGIGMQGHFGSSLTAPDDLMAILNRYAKFQKEIAVTEFDVVIEDEELAGNYARDFYTLLFSHPAVTTLTMWGFWDNNHWKKNAVMYHGDWSLKPGGKAYRDLVLGKWHTKETGSTDASGQYQLRGFKGEYAVEVKSHGQTRTVKATLADDSSHLDVKI
jgi:endo-1,4-beta-xylanase